MKTVVLDEKRWQQVNAYVDGELDPAAAATVAAEVARDRVLARAVATVTQLKAATADSVEAPVIALHAPRQSRRWQALAASFLITVALGAGLAVYVGGSGSNSLDRAVERHMDWVNAESAQTGPESAVAMLAGLARLGFRTEVPDLSDAGLMLTQVSALDSRDATAGFQIRYVGTRGCRVSLMVQRTGDEPAPGRREIGSLRAASWLVRELRYTLLASGMHEPRFDTIAATAEAATRRDRPAVETLRQALRDQREQTPPCLG
jgi:anti-sigma factor RsiW